MRLTDEEILNLVATVGPKTDMESQLAKRLAHALDWIAEAESTMAKYGLLEEKYESVH